jgi:hypothetical protein
MTDIVERLRGNRDPLRCNNEVRTTLSRIASRLKGKGAPDDTIEAQLQAIAIAIDALDFIDDLNGQGGGDDD